MRRKSPHFLGGISLFLSLAILLSGWAMAGGAASAETGQIYLYGERHGEELVLRKELEIWKDCYDAQGMRHLFVELSFFTAELLNVWMHEDTDDILEAIYADWKGTASHVPVVLAFYREIKQTCPETVFHGTDVGHQYDTTGARYLAYLRKNGMEASEQYRLAEENVEQGRQYYEKDDGAYRENKMTENFIRAFDGLDGESIMGIYGGAHVGLDAMDYETRSVPCMANQLAQRYGEAVHSEDLNWVLTDAKPLGEETMEVSGKTYTALYFGRQDLTGFRDYAYRDFWRLEDAYDDFKALPTTGDVLPYDNYLMPIETGQVFVIDIAQTNGTVTRLYYRADGTAWGGRKTTVNFEVK